MEQKYRWRYAKGGALVEKHTHFGDWLEIAVFNFGIDAKEYVETKNSRAPNQESAANTSDQTTVCNDLVPADAG